MKNNSDQIEELFKAGAHLGHKKSRIHPKAKKFIYTIEKGTSIIDLTKTVQLLENALDFVSKLSKEKKTLLVVVTKKTAASFTKELCQKYQIPYIVSKWPAGLITNFEMIIKNVKKLIQMKEEKEKGIWTKFVKKEQLQMNKTLNRLEKFYGGLVNLNKRPDALFIVDVRKEKNAVKEARYHKIPIIAITDTNVNPELADYPIPANDDSQTSIEYFVRKVVEAYTRNSKS